MKILLVFLLVVLGCIPSEGLTKCELRDKVLKEMEDLQHNGRPLDPKMMTTMVVCHAEKASGFNTTLVTNNTEATGNWTFYGIFQLGNLVVCTDDVSTNPQMCKVDCKKLIDADVKDDIKCLKEIIEKLLKDGFRRGSRFMEMIRHIYDPECIGYKYKDYFNCTQTEN